MQLRAGESGGHRTLGVEQCEDHMVWGCCSTPS
jgi:hypothetical protein